MYICTYIYTQKLSPRFLWVLKFDVKLGVVVKNFKTTIGRWFFRIWFQTCLSEPEIGLFEILFDVKLGVVVKNFKTTIGRWFFRFWSKSSFFFTDTHMENESERVPAVVCDQFSSMHLQSPFGVHWRIYTQGPKGRVYGWDGWMDGWTGYQKCSSILFILCRYIDHVYMYLYIYS